MTIVLASLERVGLASHNILLQVHWLLKMKEKAFCD
jgi:hypothetical protein